ncbi:MAG: GlsB/YeaQ/YmgE family stress response membrane protein [Acidimicrobiia bacterium]|nr:GlsB/YeaQ/YmgE family stress response membrane protein [Acidimicrobiia bacterium]
MGVLAWIAVGFIAGLVARVVVRPGHHLGCLGTIAVGLVGSLVGGTLGNVLSGDGFDVAAAGIVGSILGAVVILAFARLGNGRPPS